VGLHLRVLSLDPSKGKDADRGDYSAFVKIGIDRSGVMYIEADLQRRPTPKIVADGVEMVRQFKPDGFAIEVNQFQELLSADFLRVGQEQQTHLPIFEYNNQVNKEVRIRRLGTYLSQRKLRFKSSSPGTNLLVQQLKDFPVGDHDDGPDALELGVRLLVELWNGQGQRPVGRLVVG
jgi:predicted phage terminase large subunit-like protein